MAKKRPDNSTEDLRRSLDAGELHPVYALVGEEAFLRHRARMLIHDAIVTGQGGTVSVFSADDALEAVLAELRGDSLFATRRMVEVIAADAFLRTNGDALVRYFARPSASGVLVLDAAKIDGRTKLPNAIRSAGMLVACPTVYPDKLPGWVRAEVSVRGRRISASAVSLLVDELGSNLFAIATELDKLITYLGERKQIEAEDVARLTGHGRSWVVWALTDALGRRETASALRVLEDLLEEGGAAEQLVGSLNWQISRLLKGKYLVERGGTRRDIASQLRVGARFVDGVMAQIGQFSRDDLVRISRMLLEADILVKSSGLPSRMVLERFLVEACEGTSLRS